LRIALPVALLWLAGGLTAEVIDRIAVTVGNQVITASDLDREVRVNAFLDRVKPDFTPEGKRRTADRMVEQRLVRRELDLSRYPAPEASEVEPVVKELKDDHYPTPAAYAAALVEYGIGDREVREHILWQLTLLRFIEVRFRPAISISEEAIQEHFNKEVVPTSPQAKLDDVREEIVDTLTERQMDRDLDLWIREARKRVGVEFRDAVFNEVSK
jgi:hypothetical protein